MIVQGKAYQSIWLDPENQEAIKIIDQHRLPFEFRIEELTSSDQVLEAIRTMKVRGAPLIGVTAAFGIYLACLEARLEREWKNFVAGRAELIRSARPTAVNLAWAVERMMSSIAGAEDPGESILQAKQAAVRLMEEEKEASYRIGQHGLGLISGINLRKKGGTVNILTHCNAGWLACIDYGTATAPIYLAHDSGIPVHVWVDETRPRNQGARLTAWELGQHGVPHTVVVDNAGGHLMQKGKVDLVLVGSDRTTRRGDVANKIGTYLKALAARDNNVPFYAAMPSSSIDFGILSGMDEIRIEERSHSEVREMEGSMDGKIRTVEILPAESPVSNFGFDITPARLVTGIITERGICAADEEAIIRLYPEKKE